MAQRQRKPTYTPYIWRAPRNPQAAKMTKLRRPHLPWAPVMMTGIRSSESVQMPGVYPRKMYR